MLTGQIGRSLWRLAAPTAAEMISQIRVAIAETYFFFGRLGTEALAGFALPFTLLAWTVAPTCSGCPVGPE